MVDICDTVIEIYGCDHLARELLANEGIAVDIQAEKPDELKGPGELSYRPPRSPHCDRGLSQR